MALKELRQRRDKTTHSSSHTSIMPGSNETSLEPSVVTAEIPVQRDPNDKEGILRDNIDANQLDILSYVDLIRYYESNDQFEPGQQVYNELHERFPLFSPLWVLQLKGNLQRDEFPAVERILAQCLSGDSPNNDISLWMTYLDYVRRKNNLITGGQEARSIIIQAFELVMTKCAQFEPQSGAFWTDYLSFLETWKPMNKWEEQQKVDMIRQLYKKMLIIPFDNLEKMWNKYTKWEQDVNNLTARKFIGELSADYMKARSLYQEWYNTTKGLRRVSPVNINTCNKNNIPQPNITLSEKDVAQIKLWTKWIQWEKENKLILTDDILRERLTYVYQQSIQYMLFAPEIWYDYVMYIPETDVKSRTKLLVTSIQANPSSPSLVFKLSECYELENNPTEIKKCYESTVGFLLKQSKQLQNTQNQINDLTEIDHINKIKEKLTFIYCIYMNTMKRLSGLSAARSVFSKCRKLKDQLTHHIYIENAYLEFQNQNDVKTASKVLELGLKYFQNDGEYVLKYMDFLILVNKDSQIKQLFETSLDKVEDPVQNKQIFKKMVSYESKFGDLNNVYSLEKRFLTKYPDENVIELFTDRYQIQHENYIKKLELTYLYEADKANMAAMSYQDSKKRRRSSVNDVEMRGNKKLNQGPAVPTEITDILKVLPKRQYFKNTVLDPKNLIEFLVDQIEIPDK